MVDMKHSFISWLNITSQTQILNIISLKKANRDGENLPDGVKTVNSRYVYHNSGYFQINVPERLGPAQAIYYDCDALKKSIEIIKEEKISAPIEYIMAYRFGSLMKFFYN